MLQISERKQHLHILSPNFLMRHIGNYTQKELQLSFKPAKRKFKDDNPVSGWNEKLSTRKTAVTLRK